MARITADTIKDSVDRQKALHQLLTEMAQTEFLKEGNPQISVFASRLKELYVPDFRHRYSEFFSLLVEIDREDPDCYLNYLSHNIIEVRDYVYLQCVSGNSTYQSLYKPMMKLSDHLSLEIARYNHFVSQNKQITELTKQNQDLQAQLTETTARLHEATTKLDQANTRFSTTETKLNDAETKLNDAETKLKTIETDLPTAISDLDTVKNSLSSIHIDIIAVLSIFASIVLTFSGSMSVLGSALTGMQEVHAVKATFFVLLCGFVLGNVIFLMMYLVGKLTSRNIYARCKTDNCTCGEGGAPACRGLKRIRKRLPYIYWLNVILIFLMGLDVVIWFLDNRYNFIP